MSSIDRYAYSNRLRTVDPAQKIGLALSVVALCLTLDRPAVGLLAVGWMWWLATRRAGLPAGLFGALLLAEAFFLLLAGLGIALTVGTTASRGDGRLWDFGPFYAGFTRTSLETAARAVTRAMGAMAATNLLALTTPLVDLLDALRRWRVPVLLIELMNLVYRFVFTLLDRLTQMRIAQESRLGYVSWRRGMASAAILTSQLLVNSYDRSRRLQIALDSRGYSGSLRVLPAGYRTDRGLVWLTALVAATLLAARVLV